MCVCVMALLPRLSTKSLRNMTRSQYLYLHITVQQQYSHGTTAVLTQYKAWMVWFS